MSSLLALIASRVESWKRKQPRSTYRALVVDDEEPIRRLVERVLRAAGFETVLAEDGDDALVKAAALDPLDVLVTDLLMPHMNGDELARRLRSSNSDLKVLYLTAYSDRLFAEKGALWEDEAFVDKPCTLEGLVEAVALLLTGHTVLPAASTADKAVGDR